MQCSFSRQRMNFRFFSIYLHTNNVCNTKLPTQKTAHTLKRAKLRERFFINYILCDPNVAQHNKMKTVLTIYTKMHLVDRPNFLEIHHDFSHFWVELTVPLNVSWHKSCNKRVFLFFAIYLCSLWSTLGQRLGHFWWFLYFKLWFESSFMALSRSKENLNRCENWDKLGRKWIWVDNSSYKIVSKIAQKCTIYSQKTF